MLRILLELAKILYSLGDRSMWLKCSSFRLPLLLKHGRNHPKKKNPGRYDRDVPIPGGFKYYEL
jgi:hypothetical protein